MQLNLVYKTFHFLKFHNQCESVFLRGLFILSFLCTYIMSTSILFIGRNEN